MDGGCPNNGRQASTMFGSYVVYEITGRFIDAKSPEIHEQLSHIPVFSEAIRFDLTSAISEQDKPQKNTNNSAEALSLFCLLSELHNKKLMVPGNEITIFMDSELTINQVLKLYQIKQPHLKAIHRNIDALLDKFNKKYKINFTNVIHFEWISGDVMKQTRIGH